MSMGNREINKTFFSYLCGTEKKPIYIRGGRGGGGGGRGGRADACIPGKASINMSAMKFMQKYFDTFTQLENTNA